MTVRILQGDCRDVLRTLPDASVHCVATSPPYYGLRSYLADGHADKPHEIGLEKSPADYIATMVEVFREVRRVMRQDATCWINLGDSMAGHNVRGFRPGNEVKNGGASNKNGISVEGLAPKQLMMMPARVALALQADGWWLRSDIIWAKPNPMPESVTDRPTNAHEHVFLLTKAPRYFFDAEAVREGREGDTHSRGSKRTPPIEAAGVGHKDWCAYMTRDEELTSRNVRNVWTIATAPFPEAHFATFPPELAERCIKAGTSERGCCPKCGAPWVRESESHIEHTQRIHKHPKYGNAGQYQHAAANRHRDGHLPGFKVTNTTGWSASCSCDAGDPVPCVVLDPFAGAFTTALVADRLQRDAIGIELNPVYCDMARRRIELDAGLFSDIAAD